jgi:hypothetical protein
MSGPSQALIARQATGDDLPNLLLREIFRLVPFQQGEEQAVEHAARKAAGLWV